MISTARSCSCTSPRGTSGMRMNAGKASTAAAPFRRVPLILAALALSVSGAVMATDAAETPLAGLDEEVQSVKQDALALNRDLFLLEEELLFPANTQVAVYLSMDVGQFFGLDGVEVSIDGKRVSKFLYTEREVDALHREAFIAFTWAISRRASTSWWVSSPAAVPRAATTGGPPA